MTPLDAELRRTLANRAAVLSPSPDPLAGIEARVSRMRRRRSAATAAGALAVVAAVALAVPSVVSDRGTTAPDRLASATPTGRTSHPSVLDPAKPWPVRGDEQLLAGGALDTVQREWARRHPGSVLTPLFVQVWEPSAQTEMAFVASGDGVLRVGWVVVGEPGPAFVQEETATADSAYQFALDGDEGVTRLYVIAAPDSKVAYAPDGVTYRDITQTSVTHTDGPSSSTTTSRSGFGITAVETAGARVRVTASDGAVVYEADARGTPATAAPANLLDWPSRGTASAGPSVHDLGVAFTRALGRSDGAAVEYRPLFTGDTDSGVRYTVGQAWFRGDPQAYSVSYATGGTDGPHFFVGPVTPSAPPVLAFLVGNLPGTSVDQLVVVPAPRSGQVSYDADATGAFRPITGQDHFDGVVLIDRAKDATADRLEVLNGNGELDNPTYFGPVAALLCGLKECG
ncbi:MAG TPA: hypothetical protein VM097_11465 [Mycobacteriales bacterium]|nr:hypothetical protein [Mycobacteriales bacterium]